MHPYIRRPLQQGRPFFFGFLDPILSKQAVSSVDSIGNSIRAVGLADGDQGYGAWAAARHARCFINPRLDGVKILTNVC